jgi:hypothetical protein
MWESRESPTARTALTAPLARALPVPREVWVLMGTTENSVPMGTTVPTETTARRL